MSNATRTPLPDYERPPVIEVVCGIQFDPLPKFQATALGMFWERVRGEYPTTQEMPPLGPVIERFGAEPDSGAAQMELPAVPPLPRMFLIHQIPNWLIQLQRERFLHNWRKVNKSDPYPRYPTVFEKFWNAWTEFLGFCRAEKLGEPAINQCEITYINHIPAGEGWETIGDLGEVFPDLKWRADRAFLPCPDSAAWRVAFTLPESKGRLHVSLKHAIRREDSQPVLLCELTARGLPSSGEDNAVQEWFELGREWIVRGFADLTGEQIQENVWIRRA